MTMKHERPMKPATLDKLDRNRQANAQKTPWPLKDIHKFHKGLHPSDKGQHPKR
jgi:hypothetical protein